MEKQCEVQLLTDAAVSAGVSNDDDGKPVALTSDEIQFYARETGSERAGYFVAQVKPSCCLLMFYMKCGD